MLGTHLRLQNQVERLKNSEEAQGLVEYALILLMVSIAGIVAMGVLGTAVSNMYSIVVTSI